MATSKSDSQSSQADVQDAQATVIPDREASGPRDPLAEAKRVDELANWHPTAQQSSREDEGRHRRREEAGTFGVSDSPNARDK